MKNNAQRQMSFSYRPDDGNDQSGISSVAMAEMGRATGAPSGPKNIMTASRLIGWRAARRRLPAARPQACGIAMLGDVLSPYMGGHGSFPCLFDLC